jgi:hypothetical protein
VHHLKTGKDSPGALAREVKRRLAAQGDPRRAAGALRYFKAYETLSFYGLKTAEVRDVVREVYLRISPPMGRGRRGGVL